MVGAVGISGYLHKLFSFGNSKISNEFNPFFSTHLYKLNGAWPVTGESVARYDLRLYLGHDGEHDLHLADHRVSSL